MRICIGKSSHSEGKKIEISENNSAPEMLAVRQALFTSTRMGLHRPIVSSIAGIGSIKSYKQFQLGSEHQSASPRFPRLSSSLPQFSEVDYDQLVEILKNKKATVIDVRNPEELQDHGAIPGAVNIPLKDLKVLYRNQNIWDNWWLVGDSDRQPGYSQVPGPGLLLHGWSQEQEGRGDRLQLRLHQPPGLRRRLVRLGWPPEPELVQNRALESVYWLQTSPVTECDTLKWESKLKVLSLTNDNFREITAKEMADRLTQLQDAVNAVSLDDDDDDDICCFLSKRTISVTVSGSSSKYPSPRPSQAWATPRPLRTTPATTPTTRSCSPRWSPGLGRISRCWSTVCRARRARRSSRLPDWGSWSRRARSRGNSWGRAWSRASSSWPVSRCDSPSPGGAVSDIIVLSGGPQ